MSSTDPNKLFRVKLGQGEPVLRILLSQQQASRVSVSASNTGSARAGDNRVQRRLRRSDSIIPKKGGSFINFYDFGEYFDGAWNFLRFYMYPTVDWDTYNSTLLAFTDRTNTIRKVSKTRSPKYGIQFALNSGTIIDYTDGEPNVEEAGYKYTGTITELEVSTFRAAYGVTLPSADFKITATPDYSDPEVTDFELSGNVNIFLCPTIGVSYGQVTLDIPEPDPGQSVENLIFYDLMSRELLDFAGSDHAAESAFVGFSDSTIAAFNELLGSIDSNGSESWVNVEAGGGPITPVAGPHYLTLSDISGSILLQHHLSEMKAEGTLQMIIEQPSGTYYVWTAEEVENFTTSMTLSIVN